MKGSLTGRIFSLIGFLSVRIAELYESRQGEGRLTGQLSVFVRTSGCNLRCWFCDTPFTSWEPEGDELPWDALLAKMEAFSTRHVVITGGEPMLTADLVPLTENLNRNGWHITIETAGTVDLPVACDLMSISPKLANSTPDQQKAPTWSQRHERTRHRPEVIQRLTSAYDYQLKFVIDTPKDVNDVELWLAEFPHVERKRIMLMPQGTTPHELAERAAWLEPLATQAGFVFCPRMHIEWYGFTRGT